MDITPVTRKEHFLARAAGDSDALELQPSTREEHLLQNIIDAIKQGGGGGGSVTPASIVTATGEMTEAQAAQTLANIGGAGELFVVTFAYNETMSQWQANKTYSEIAAADAAGKTIVFNVEGWFSLANYVNEGGEPMYKAVVMSSSKKMYAVWTASNAFIGDVVSVYELAEKEKTITVSGTTPTVDPSSDTNYKCGELTSMTISNPPSTGSYSIVFTSGATATSTTIPSTILGLESFAAEANTVYEINVLDNRAVVGSWAVSA